MSFKDKIKNKTLDLLEKHADDYKNEPLKPTKDPHAVRKSTNKKGYTFLGFPIKVEDLKKLNLISFIEGVEKGEVRERAIADFLAKYDENGKRL